MTAKVRYFTAFLLAALSLGATNAWADDIVPPKVDVSTPAGVNIVSGYFQLGDTDLSMGTLKLERFTLPPAKLPVNDPYFGAGITHNFDIYVAPTFIKAIPPPYPRTAEYHPIVHIGQGASGVFVQSSPSNSTILPFNIEAQKGILALVGGAYVYTDQAGTIYTFNPSVHAGGGSGTSSQRIANILYADGRRETFGYNASSQLKIVSDNAGYAIVFDYNGSGDVSAACIWDLAQDYVTATSTCASATNKVTYGYTSSLLTSITDTMQQVTTYSHYGTTYGAPISCVTPPGYGACKVQNTFDGLKRVYQQTLLDGAVYSLAFDIICNPDPLFPEGGGDCEVDASDPVGTSSLSFSHSSPIGITDANGHATAYHWMGAPLQWPSYDQSPNGPYLVEADFPEGNKFLAEYNGNFNLISRATRIAKPGSGLADLVETWGYGPCYSPGTLQNCGKPIWKKDPLNHQWDYAYYTWGGPQWEMGPAPAAGAARPLKLYSFSQRYAYIKNASGVLIPAATPVWTLDTETACQTVTGSSSPVCDTAAPVLTTTSSYGANGTVDNLLVRGRAVSDGVTVLRTCYGYDALSRKISETQPNANLSSCP